MLTRIYQRIEQLPLDRLCDLLAPALSASYEEQLEILNAVSVDARVAAVLQVMDNTVFRMVIEDGAPWSIKWRWR